MTYNPVIIDLQVGYVGIIRELSVVETASTLEDLLSKLKGYVDDEYTEPIMSSLTYTTSDTYHMKMIAQLDDLAFFLNSFEDQMRSMVKYNDSAEVDDLQQLYYETKNDYNISEYLE